MLFNSFAFAVFLPIVVTIYWGIPHRVRWVLLLISSYYFYMSWNPKYIFLIFMTTVVSYCAGLLLERAKSKKYKKYILAGAAIICLSVLFFFKYFNFCSHSIVKGFEVIGISLHPVTLKFILPVGISFYTFQTLSYVIDVYKGRVKAELHFGHYATFISFFPQLVAGPIERTQNLLPQIKNEHSFSYQQATYGLKLMAIGYFKKIVIADSLSQYVACVFDSPQQYQGFALVLAVLFFTLQIYCDFSGYSDIAIGTAKLMGVDLMTNFRSPYFSQSIKEFWGRWHISLSTWFRDYVYIPLGGNRVGKVKHKLNLLITFLVSGLWHGANWTFVIWGGVHGIAQIIESLTNIPYRSKKIYVRVLRCIFVFAFCAFAWIFFVSNTVTDAVYVMTHLFDNLSHLISYLHDGFSDLGMSKITFCIVCGLICILGVYDFISLKVDVIASISHQNIIIRWLVYINFILVIVFFSQKGVAAEFVYFQF